MAKRGNAPVVADKGDFLLPKMEFYQTGEMPDGTPKGFYFKELGGTALLEFKETIEAMKRDVGEETELKPHQAVKLTAKFIILSACDAGGKRIFDESDETLLAEKDPNILLDMVNIAMPLSGMSAKVLSEVAVDLKNDLPDSSITT